MAAKPAYPTAVARINIANPETLVLRKSKVIFNQRIRDLSRWTRGSSQVREREGAAEHGARAAAGPPRGIDAGRPAGAHGRLPATEAQMRFTMSFVEHSECIGVLTQSLSLFSYYPLSHRGEQSYMW